MRSPTLCTDEEITRMVHSFYADVRQDVLLGPIFNTHVQDWDHHLARLSDFWSSMLRGSRAYSGTPMARHVALPGLNGQLFQRWLALFRVTTQAQANKAMGQLAYESAERIAQSLWYGYQFSKDPDAPVQELPRG